MKLRRLASVGAVAWVLAAGAASAATIQWKGHTWQVTSGGMAGVCDGNPANVSVDSNGYLHMKITNNGGTWTAAEIFSTEKMGFGTYQWQVDGPIDTYDKNVVLGLFPYGPAAGIGGDGTNEIDIEYSRWGRADAPNADWTDYPASGKTIGELTYNFSLGGGTLSTSRFEWTKTGITDWLLGGLAPVGSTAGQIKTWTYAPQNPTVNIPQQALPLGMNLWCFDAPPSDGKPVEIVIRDFQFVPEGASPGDGGAGDGAAPDAGAMDAGGSGTAGSSGDAGHRQDAAVATDARDGGAAGVAGTTSPPTGAAGAGGGAGATGGASAGTGGGAAGTIGGAAGVTGAAGSTGASGVSGAGTGAAGTAGATHHASGCSLAPPRQREGGLGLVLFFLASIAIGRRRRR